MGMVVDELQQPLSIECQHFQFLYGTGGRGTGTAIQETDIAEYVADAWLGDNQLLSLIVLDPHFRPAFAYDVDGVSGIAILVNRVVLGVSLGLKQRNKCLAFCVIE